tara:strand:+ start:1076 stop:1327 length:252 start_codon:yes stop_codon:yes gene_type:complete
MTEKDLIELGFEKDVIEDSESQNGFDYYYYKKDFYEGLTFLSHGSDEIIDDNWIIYNPDWLDIEIKDIEILKELINVFSKIKG